MPPFLNKSMRKDQELNVITKTYDLILWSCDHTSKFPRNHRFVLGERIELSFQRAAAKPSSASGRDEEQSTGERPLGEP